MVAIPFGEAEPEFAFTDILKLPKVQRPDKPAPPPARRTKKKKGPEKPKRMWNLQDEKVRAYLEWQCAETEASEKKKEKKEKDVKDAVKFLNNKRKPVGSPRLGRPLNAKKSSRGRGRGRKNRF